MKCLEKWNEWLTKVSFFFPFVWIHSYGLSHSNQLQKLGKITVLRGVSRMLPSDAPLQTQEFKNQVGAGSEYKNVGHAWEEDQRAIFTWQKLP